MRVTIAVTAVEMDDGRLALLVETEPDLGLGPLVVGPLGEASAIARQDGPEELS
jgi:hypothetical protein